MFNLYRKNVDSTAILLKLEVDEDEDEKSTDNVPRKYFINDFLYSGTILLHTCRLHYNCVMISYVITVE